MIVNIYYSSFPDCAFNFPQDKFETFNLSPAYIAQVRKIFLDSRKEVGLSSHCVAYREQIEILKADLIVKMDLDNAKIKRTELQMKLVRIKLIVLRFINN